VNGEIKTQFTSKADGKCVHTTCIMCVTKETTQQIQLNAGPNTITVNTTTQDGWYHQDAYFRVRFQEASCDVDCSGCELTGSGGLIEAGVSSDEPDMIFVPTVIVVEGETYFAGCVEGELQGGVVMQGDKGHSEGGAYHIGGTGNFVRWTVPEPLTGDFQVRSEVLFEKLEATACGFVLWHKDGTVDVTDLVGFDGSSNSMFYEGDQWGSPSFGGPGPAPNVWHEVLLKRTDGKLTVSVNGVAVFTDLSCDWTVLGVGWRPHRNTIQIRSLLLLNGEETTTTGGGT